MSTALATATTTTTTETLDAPTVPADFTFESDCQCYHCPTCHTSYVGYSDENCDECEGEVVPAGYCDGACYESELEYFNQLVDEWFTANPSVSAWDAQVEYASRHKCEPWQVSERDIEGAYGYRITGRNMGWLLLTGTCDLPEAVSGSELIGKLAGNVNEYTQRWTIDPVAGGVFKCRQSTHDVPTGESYEVCVL